MAMKMAGGFRENGIVVGNTYDKYNARNPLVRWMMNGFGSTLSALVARVEPGSIHEIGCGEGYWVLQWHAQGIATRGSDFSLRAIQIARDNALDHGAPASLFETRSIYDLDPANDSADLVVCCEVLEHLADPDAALRALQRIVSRHLIVSVPREPLWRVLNVARGKYLPSLGNTPGHLNHWSAPAFVGKIAQYFDVVEIRQPLPWTMLLCRQRA